MKDKFRNKYRSDSARKQSWDYGSDGAYFVTICTHNRVKYFGEILVTNGEKNRMNFTDTGKLAEQFWLEIPNHFGFVQLDAFVVMPDHIHGIIIINKMGNPTVRTPRLGVRIESHNLDAPNSPELDADFGTPKLDVDFGTPKLDVDFGTPKLDADFGTPKLDVDFGTPKLDVPTGIKTLDDPTKKWKPGTLGVMINQYKRICTIHARKINPEFSWQPRFYEHIIRDEQSFNQIKQYINLNPDQWKG